MPTPPAGTQECGIELNRESAVRPSALLVARKLAVPLFSAGEEQASRFVAVRRDAVVLPRGQAIPAGTIKVDGKFRTTREGVFAAGNVVDGPTQAGYASLEGMMAARFVAEYLETADWRSEKLSEVPGWEELLVG